MNKIKNIKITPNKVVNETERISDVINTKEGTLKSIFVFGMWTDEHISECEKFYKNNPKVIVEEFFGRYCDALIMINHLHNTDLGFTHIYFCNNETILNEVFTLLDRDQIYFIDTKRKEDLIYCLTQIGGINHGRNIMTAYLDGRLEAFWE